MIFVKYKGKVKLNWLNDLIIKKNDINKIFNNYNILNGMLWGLFKVYVNFKII